MELRTSKQHLQNIDSLKGVLSILVVCLHVPIAESELFVPLARIAVPMFFMISGYLIALRDYNYVKGVLKIGRYFLSASVVYLLARTILPANDFFGANLNIESIRILLLYNVTSYGQHLWYLPAYIYVLLIASIVKKHFHIRYAIWSLVPILIITHFILGEFHQTVFGTPSKVMWVRNFLFTGLPFYFCGDWIACHTQTHNWDRRMCLFLIILFSVCSIWEYNYYSEARKTDLLLSSIPLCIASFYYAINISNANHCLSCLGKRYSLWLYVMHPFVYYVTLLVLPKVEATVVIFITISVKWIYNSLIAHKNTPPQCLQLQFITCNHRYGYCAQ